jgi:hypothetical protein
LISFISLDTALTSHREKEAEMGKHIEVTLEVWKEIIQLYRSEKSTENEVIRELLDFHHAGNLLNTESLVLPAKASWMSQGVILPDGTELRRILGEKTSYGEKGEVFSGIVQNGTLVINGKSYNTPSAAAFAITDYGVNGWDFWEAKLPSTSQWVSLHRLREQAK